MTYEAPELIPLAPAIEAIQSSLRKGQSGPIENRIENELRHAYADWE